MWSSKKFFRGIFLGIFLLVTIFVWYRVWAEERNGILTVAFLDVGQGDAIFIETPTGKQILVDAGPNKKVLRELAKQMPFYDKSLDIVVMTHPDSDHIGGFPAILENYVVDLVLGTEVKCQSELCVGLEEQIGTKKIEKKNVHRGMLISLEENLFLSILFPDRDPTDFETNLASVVMKLVYGETSFLLTGDSPKEIEEYLTFLDSVGLDVDVLKLGHHGSKTSSSENFLGFTSPEVVVISVGKENRYGHPHPEVLDLLEKFEVKILRTDEQGTIVIRSDGSQLIY